MRHDTRPARSSRASSSWLCLLAVVLALVPLAFILFFVVTQGLLSLNVDFFTHIPGAGRRVGGGMANAIVGTLMMVGLGALIAIPIGVTAGVYAAEFAHTRLATAVRFAADTLNGVPSIVIGVFVYGVAVLPVKQLQRARRRRWRWAIMMIPIIARTTEELLQLVPVSLREGALALGATRGWAMLSVVLPAAAPGIITGILLALARIAGETAPLLFTAFNNRFFSTRLDQPIASLTVQIFTYAISPVRGLASPGLGRRAGPGRAGAVVLDPRARWPHDGSSTCRPGSKHDGFHRHGGSNLQPLPRTHGLTSDAAAGRRKDHAPIAATRSRSTSTGCRSSTARSRRCSTSPRSCAVNLVTAFIGPSGCGKSTFLRTLNRMNDTIAGARVTGRVLIDGKDIYGSDVDAGRAPADGRAWCSRSRTRSRSRSTTTSPTACA